MNTAALSKAAGVPQVDAGDTTDPYGAASTSAGSVVRLEHTLKDLQQEFVIPA